MQNVRHITLEAVFLLGILSAKTGKVLSDGPIGNEEFVPAVFFTFDEISDACIDFDRSSAVETLYLLMAHNMIQCSFVGVGSTPWPGSTVAFSISLKSALTAQMAL